MTVSTLADATLRTTARIWFALAILGQLLFAFTVAFFYGRTAARGDWWAWNRHMTHGYIAGAEGGNFMVGMHLGSAVIILLAGVVQFIPQIRSRFPRVHRWTGRLYMLTALTLTAAGLYMHWIRGSVGDDAQRIGSTVNAVLIWVFGAIALRYALVRNFGAHRRWAIRFYLVVNASFFIRAMLFLWFIIWRRPVGFDPTTFTGPVLTAMIYAQFVVPLAVAELYFLAQSRPGAARRFAMAGVMAVMTLGMTAGLFAVTAANWMRGIREALDARRSIAQTMEAAIESNGIDAAERQYRVLRAANPIDYNFEESQLNTLGYQFLRARKFNEAIRLFRLNIEAYPKSSNAVDSLAEAYLKQGNKPQAVAYYRRAVALNPKNLNATIMLRRLNG